LRAQRSGTVPAWARSPRRRSALDADAIVVGAGPNGLVAANVLADAGWDVLVLEAEDEPGGAVKSAELIEPGFVHDVFSSFYPLAAFSPAIRGLGLENHGLRWRHGPLALAHPATDGSCVVLSRDLDETAASLDAFAAGDGARWRELAALWHRLEPAARAAIVTPFPPVRAGLHVLRRFAPRELPSLLREMVLPARRYAEEHFRGAGGRRLLAGNALHADLTPESAIGGFFAFVLCSLGQTVGFPVAEGGAGNLTRALVRRLDARGGRVLCGRRVTGVLANGRRAAGVRTAGESFRARRAVLADVDAPSLYLDLIPREVVSPSFLARIERFEWDWSTVKVDWTLDGPIPWKAADAGRAPTIHVADSLEELALSTAQAAAGFLPEKPFLILGQYSTADPTRCPEGREVAWAYTRIPRRAHGDAAGELSGEWRSGEAERFLERMEERIEALAPGFRSLVRRRHVLMPGDLERLDSNLVGGALNGGTAQLHQQLIFRPLAGLGRPETPLRSLYLASASAHPGGGVHGGPGAIAARAAMRAHRLRR
jgi:phytoene dehydrogenase-like protein